jgi:hypothetical protein
MDSLWKEFYMDDHKQMPNGLEGSASYRAFREQEYLEYQESLKKKRKKSEAPKSVDPRNGETVPKNDK